LFSQFTSQTGCDPGDQAEEHTAEQEQNYTVSDDNVHNLEVVTVHLGDIFPLSSSKKFAAQRVETSDIFSQFHRLVVLLSCTIQRWSVPAQED